MKDQVRGTTRSRRQHEREFKDDLIAQSLVAGASVSSIAMKGGINANLLFKWRREHVRAKIESVPAAGTLLPVCVIRDVDSSPISQPPAPDDAAVGRSARQGVIEIDIAGAQLRLRGAVDEMMLGTVFRALRQSQ